jgi:predicted enzyme related to lactoylglutathione lyase
MGKIVHTEFVSANAKATADFVTKMFGWRMEKMNTPGMEYYMWNYPDGQMDAGGGIGNTSSEHRQPSPHINIFVDVENLAAAIEKAKSLGATLLTPETAIPDGGGYFAVLSEPGGCTLGIWSQKPSK